MITEQDVRKAIAKARDNFDADALPIDADFGDAGLDSLDQASVLLELQEATGIEFPEDASNLNSIEAVLHYAQSRQS
ncbi:MAG TPA: phosphopantetheine-binding protein [Rhizomicrobium sp.]|nr:phosphopantetheine-binding protein [Rhizomicrobium sp.]